MLKWLNIIGLIVLSFCTCIYPQTAEEIVNQAEEALKGDTAYGVVEMTVVRPEYTREMKMESWWVENEKALIVIKSPKKEAGNKTLKLGNEMWNYLANTETTIKIPPSMMLQSWNGSDFTNDDLVREANLSKDYDQELTGEEKIDGDMCWKIKLTPKTDAPVVWGKLFYWVRQKDFLPARIDYYDEKGELIRYLTYSNYQQVRDRKIPTKWVMHDNIKEKRYTVIEVIDMKYGIDIDERRFSFRELERGG